MTIGPRWALFAQLLPGPGTIIDRQKAEPLCPAVNRPYLHTTVLYQGSKVRSERSEFLRAIGGSGEKIMLQVRGLKLPRGRLKAMIAPRTHKLPYDAEAAVRALGAADPKLGRLIERAGPFTLRLPRQQSPFEALLRSILYQQLHGKAAAAIHAKLLNSFEPVSGLGKHPSAQHVLECPNEQLRAAGLSHNKALAIRDLAAKTVDGTVPSLARIRRMTDEEIIEHFTQVRGVGRWTVEMFLMFRLGRPDVLPVSDYGVRKGFALTFQGLKPRDKVTPDVLPKADVMERRARKWAPWRSVASWYLWRACDLAAGKAVQPE